MKKSRTRHTQEERGRSIGTGKGGKESGEDLAYAEKHGADPESRRELAIMTAHLIEEEEVKVKDLFYFFPTLIY